MDYYMTPFHNPIMFHWHQKNTRDTQKKHTCRTSTLHAQAESSLECYLRVCLEMRVHNWAEQVKGECAKDKRGERPQHWKVRGSWGLTVVWFDWALYVPQIWRVPPVRYGKQWGARSKEQETGGKRGGEEVDGAQTEATGRGSNKKCATRTREKDRVSQAGAERLKFQWS